MPKMRVDMPKTRVVRQHVEITRRHAKMRADLSKPIPQRECLGVPFSISGQRFVMSARVIPIGEVRLLKCHVFLLLRH